MNKQSFRLTSAEIVANCINLISVWWKPQHDAGKTLIVEIKRLNRSLEQNRQALQVLYPHIEFEQPPLTGSDLAKALIKKGWCGFNCVCGNSVNKPRQRRHAFYYEKLKHEKFKQAAKALPMPPIKMIKRVRVKP